MRIPLRLAKPGMKLEKPIYWDGRLLVPQGTELQASTLERLAARGITGVSVVDPRVADVAQYFTISAETRASGIELLQKFSAEVRTRRYVVPAEACVRLVRQLELELGEQAERSLQLLPCESPADYLFVEALNTAIICLAVAKDRVQKGSLHIDAGVAGLLHDIGLLVQPSATRPGELLDPNNPVYQEHPRHGLEILQQSRVLTSYVKAAVVQHHERKDGSGFPRRLKGDAIHWIGSLVGLGELYNDLVNGFTSYGPLLPYEAIEYITSLSGLEFPADLVADFLKVVVPYPIGTLVRLNSNEVGLVVHVPKHLPTRPTVRVLTTPEGEDLPVGRDVNLADRQYLTLLITEVLAG